MNTVNLLTTHLPTFIEELRLAGYNLGATQFIQTQQLLLALAKQGALPTQLVQLKSLLASVLCHSPKEQEDFQWRFHNWLQRVDRLDSKPRLTSQSPSLLKNSRLWKGGIIAVLLLLIGFLIFFHGVTPVAVVVAMLVFSYFLAKQLWQHYLINVHVPKKFGVVPLSLPTFSINELSTRLFQPIQLWRTVQQLRQPVSIPSPPNLLPLLQGDFRQGGEMTKSVPVEYLVLTSPPVVPDDHGAAYMDAFLRILAEEGMSLTRYVFDDGPQGDFLTFKSLGNGPSVSLPELAKRYPQHRLLVFLHGDDWRKFVTDDAATASIFSHWSQGAMFTLAPQQYEETFPVKVPILPATLTGLKDFLDYLVSPRHEGPMEPDYFPSLLRDSAPRWLAAQPPNVATQKQLLKQLYLYLGKDAYNWLSACAIYPKLHWSRTLYLGDKLIHSPAGQPAVLAESLFKLVRLPWFHHGQFPDWLRQRLLKNWLSQPGSRKFLKKLI